MNKDKFICEQLGICWHEIDGEVEDDDVFRIFCLKCGKDTGDNSLSNPDFTSDPGKVRLLREIIKMESYLAFVMSIGVFNKDGQLCIPINYITDTTGKLRDAVFEWLGGKDG